MARGWHGRRCSHLAATAPSSAAGVRPVPGDHCLIGKSPEGSRQLGWEPRISALRVLRRSVSLAAVGILAVMLTACTGGGGGYLPPDTVFTGKASCGSQVERAYKNVLEVLRSVGTTQENVVKQTILVAKGQDIRSGYAAAQRVWGAHPMALTVHIVVGFGIPGALVGIEVVCALGE